MLFRSIAGHVAAALNAAVMQLSTGGQVALAQSTAALLQELGTLADSGGVTVSTTSDPNGKYVFVKLYQGQHPIAVNYSLAPATATPFNPTLPGVPQPALFNNSPYLVGTDQFGALLPDNSPNNSLLQLPKNVVLMADAGAVFKLDKANIEVGSSDLNIDDSQSALQALGVPGNQVTFTSYNDDSPALGAPRS